MSTANQTTEPPILMLAREVVETHSYRHFDFAANERAREGDKNAVLLDATTAHMFTRVYDALGETNQTKFRKIMTEDPQRAIDIALKMIARASK